jgi:hypothetical protein
MGVSLASIVRLGDPGEGASFSRVTLRSALGTALVSFHSIATPQPTPQEGARRLEHVETCMPVLAPPPE